MTRTLVSLVAAVLALTGCSPAAGSANGDENGDENGDNETVTASHCGVERWAVKTGTDTTAPTINLAKPPTQTTVGALGALTPPRALPATTRVRPIETTVYTLSGVLTSYKLEADNDYHLVVVDGSHTMIVEIPSPTCVRGGPLRAGISNARREFDARYHPTPTFQHVNAPVTVTGVGFFDVPHGQTGVAPNAVELHPAVDIKFQ